MKKILIAYGVLILIVIILAVVKFGSINIFPNPKPQATINGHTFNLLIAKNDKSRQIGLSNRKSLDKNTGMIFVFPKKGIYSFWMHNTLIPLDMIFIDDNKIVYIVKNAQPPDKNPGKQPIIYTPTANSNYVIEINGGLSDKYKIAIGNKVNLKNLK